MIKNKIVVICSLVFVLVTSISGHLFFSHLGFNPTDDGYPLAASRRILDGEIPHRDFVSVRPALSHYIHAPIISFNKKHLLLLSRYFVLIEFSLISLSWLFIANKLLKINFFKNTKNLMLFFSIGLLSFIYNLHNFPIMVWQSIDAMFFSSVGIALLTHADKRTSLKIMAYMLIGCSPLLKQNFVLIPIFTFILFFKKKNFLDSLAMAIPGLLYLFFLAINNAIEPMIAQLFYKNNYNFFTYLRVPNSFLMVLLGIIAGFSLKSKSMFLKSFASLLSLGFLIYISMSLRNASGFLTKYSFYLFYYLLALSIASLLWIKKSRSLFLFQVLSLLSAFTISISLGYNSPALASGILIMTILLSAYKEIEKKNIALVLSGSLFLIMFLLSLQNFIFMRTYGVYRDKPAKFLKYDLGGVLGGGAGIKTNKLTYQYLKDLKEIISKTNKPYVLLPDNSIHWVTSKQRNPLSVDWPQPIELANQKIRKKALSDLDKHFSSGGVAIIQKINASTLFIGKIKLNKDEYALVKHTVDSYEKFDETEFFATYKKVSE
ncbi:MAG: hypothetical protein ABFQ62_00510 [Patescibacteria group bacterium]